MIEVWRAGRLTAVLRPRLADRDPAHESFHLSIEGSV
jgi:hypothetical protein